MERDEKVCPRCAETVKAAALVCKHCSYQFGAPIQPTSTATVSHPEKKKRPFMVGCLTLFAILVALGIIGSQVTPSDHSSSAGSEASVPEVAPVAITSVQLAAAYNANEVAAQNMFGDKMLDVTGVVTGVTLDFKDDPVLQMQGVNQFLSVQASFDKSFKERLGAYSKGDRVTVRCTKITEVISAPMLSDCSIP